VPSPSEPLEIGYGASTSFSGSIDEVRYHSRALTAAEVYADYAGGSADRSPAWSSGGSLTTPAGSSGSAYTGQSLAGFASDPDTGDTLTFTKLSGPAWLTIASKAAFALVTPEGRGRLPRIGTVNARTNPPATYAAALRRLSGKLVTRRCTARCGAHGLFRLNARGKSRAS
jgi:hypothetical protein